MTNKKIRLFTFIIGGFFLFLDQMLKYFAKTNPEISYLWKEFIGWEFYANKGLAFSLPFPNLIILIITPIIIFLIIAYFLKTKPENKLTRLSLLLIILGALSNFIDRMIFGITIDYLRIFTGVINLADVMIAVGVLFLIIKKSR